MVAIFLSSAVRISPLPGIYDVLMVKSNRFLHVEREGTALLEILSNHHQTWGFKVRGDVVFNGVTTVPAGLHDRVAFVQQDARWNPDMTVRQTLLFSALLQAPGHLNRNFDTKGRVSTSLHSGVIRKKQ